MSCKPTETHSLLSSTVDLSNINAGSFYARIFIHYSDDGNGNIDSTIVTSGQDGVTGIKNHSFSNKITADSFSYTLPPAGVTFTGYVCAEAVRRGLHSAKSCGKWSKSTQDTPPPPIVVDSVISLRFGSPDSFIAVGTHPLCLSVMDSSGVWHTSVYTPCDGHRTNSFNDLNIYAVYHRPVSITIAANRQFIKLAAVGVATQTFSDLSP